MRVLEARRAQSGEHFLRSQAWSDFCVLGSGEGGGTGRLSQLVFPQTAETAGARPEGACHAVCTCPAFHQLPRQHGDVSTRIKPIL